jgi:hypothetical protein
MIRSRSAISIQLLLLVALVLAFIGGPVNGGTETVAKSGTVAFTVKGNVGGLYPGQWRRATITVRNTYSRRIVVRRIFASSVRTNRAHCKASTVTSPGWHGSRSVGKRRSVKVALRFQMKPSAPAACQGATYTLRYSGRGTAR